MPGDDIFLIGEGEEGGMEGVAREEEGGGGFRGPAVFDLPQVPLGGRTVELVADQREAGVGEMNADLVHPSSVRGGRNDAEAPAIAGLAGKAPHDAAGRPARGPIGMHGLHQVDVRIHDVTPAQDGGIDFEGIPVGPAPDDGGVFLVNLAPHHGLVQAPGRFPALRHDGQSARFAVEPVDDGKVIAVHEIAGEQGAQTVPQGRWPAGFRGMHLQRSGLVHDNPVGIFIDHAEIEDIAGTVRLHGDCLLRRLASARSRYLSRSARSRATLSF